MAKLQIVADAERLMESVRETVQERERMLIENADLRRVVTEQEKEINDLQREAIVMAKENGKFRYYIVELERMVDSVALRRDAARMADRKFGEAYPDVPEVKLWV